jgi:hypothetical protein
VSSDPIIIFLNFLGINKCSLLPQKTLKMQWAGSVSSSLV